MLAATAIVRETLARCRPQAFVRAGRIRPDRRRLYALLRRMAGVARAFAGRNRRAAFGGHAAPRDRGAGDGHHRGRAQRPPRHDACSLWRDVSGLRRAQLGEPALSYLHGRRARQYRGRCGFAAARKRERAAIGAFQFRLRPCAALGIERFHGRQSARGRACLALGHVRDRAVAGDFDRAQSSVDPSASAAARAADQKRSRFAHARHARRSARTHALARVCGFPYRGELRSGQPRLLLFLWRTSLAAIGL